MNFEIFNPLILFEVAWSTMIDLNVRIGFTYLASTAVIAFARRATIDAQIANNRDAAARVEALARGGVQIATLLLLREAGGEDVPAGDTYLSGWARAKDYRIETEDGGSLHLEILDAGSRLNLNAVLEARTATDTTSDETVAFLMDFFDKSTPTSTSTSASVIAGGATVISSPYRPRGRIVGVIEPPRARF